MKRSISGGLDVEFWFEFASTYSYPAAMLIEARARAAKVPVRWCAFLLGPIFRAQGWNDSPFNLYPAKGRYMWRDMELSFLTSMTHLERRFSHGHDPGGGVIFSRA